MAGSWSLLSNGVTSTFSCHVGWILEIIECPHPVFYFVVTGPQLAVHNVCGVPATSTHSQAFPSARNLPSTASREEVHSFQIVAALAMTASPSLMYHYTTNCQPTHHPPFVRSPMKQETVQLLHRRSPCVRMIEPRSKSTKKCFMVARKARQSKVQLYFLRDLNGM